jgi:LysM repeat protein
MVQGYAEWGFVMDIKALMSKKIGGIPYLYIAGLFVVVLMVVAMRMKSTTTSTENTPSTPSDEGESTTDAETEASADYGFAATRGTVTVSDQSGVTTTATALDTNELWLKRAVEWLISSGIGAGEAQSAISKYLDGASLSYAEGQMRDKAVKEFGLPPEPITPGATAAAPGKRQGNPPCTHTIKGPNDNTFTKLALIYYSRQDGDAIDFLQAANTRLGHKGPFPVDTKVTIPKWKNPKYVTAKKGMTTLAQIASKNGVSQAMITELNDGVKFPVKVGKRVRVA